MPRAPLQPVFVDRKTAEKLPRGVFRIRTRQGGFYYYWQEGRTLPKDKRGPLVRLPDDPTSLAFADALNDAMRSARLPMIEDPAPKPGQGYVYFLVSGAYVKIGFSTKPSGRLSTLSTGLGSGVAAFVLVKGSRALEARLHRRFRDDRTHGEWFHKTKKLMSTVALAAQGRLSEDEEP